MMNNNDLIVNLEAMRKAGEFDADILMDNLGIPHGKTIHLPMLNCSVYLDCEFKKESLPAFIEPFRFDSETFWG